MRTDFSVTLNDVNLLNLHESIYVEDIHEEPKVRLDTENRGSYGATLLNEPERESLDIKITLKIKEFDRVKRQSIINAIKGWAKKGWLKTNLRDNQRIYVVCSQPMTHRSFPTHESMEMTFTAYDEAYWQEIEPVTATTSGKTKELTITPLGTRDCFLEAKIKNVSGETASVVELSANGYAYTFNGLSFADDNTLRLYYDQYHLLWAYIGATSVLSKRTEQSSDHIKLLPRQVNTVYFHCDKTCDVEIYARGLYD